MPRLEDLNIEIYADGSVEEDIIRMSASPLVKGFTTNPTLMRKAGVTDYTAFALRMLKAVKDKPVSFEVLSDDFDEMRQQALLMNQWAPNVFVKVPIMNMRRESSLPLVRDLSRAGVQVNVTAVIADEQVLPAIRALDPAVPGIVSIFAGRIADTMRDPLVTMTRAAANARRHGEKTKILWASVREPLNIFHAAKCGCRIVTVPYDILTKAIWMDGMDLLDLSAKTVQMFVRDATEAGFTL